MGYEVSEEWGDVGEETSCCILDQLESVDGGGAHARED